MNQQVNFSYFDRPSLVQCIHWTIRISIVVSLNYYNSFDGIKWIPSFFWSFACWLFLTRSINWIKKFHVVKFNLNTKNGSNKSKEFYDCPLLFDKGYFFEFNCSIVFFSTELNWKMNSWNRIDNPIQLWLLWSQLRSLYNWIIIIQQSWIP